MKAERSADLAPHGFFLPRKGVTYDEIRLRLKEGNFSGSHRCHPYSTQTNERLSISGGKDRNSWRNFVKKAIPPGTKGSGWSQPSLCSDLHALCKPEKAAKSLSANPERAILMPKFIMTFTKHGKTQIRFLSFSEDNIRSVVDDDVFPASLAETYKKIHDMIEEAK